jgi:hypothetical protein
LCLCVCACVPLPLPLPLPTTPTLLGVRMTLTPPCLRRCCLDAGVCDSDDDCDCDCDENADLVGDDAADADAAASAASACFRACSLHVGMCRRWSSAATRVSEACVRPRMTTSL